MASALFVKKHSKAINGILSKQVNEKGIPTHMEIAPHIALTLTETVKEKSIKEIEKIFGTKAVKIKIIPLLFERLCHYNVENVRMATGEGQHILGYNITSCMCGKHCSIELHSVLKVNDEYFDFTKDYAKEKEKWFIPLHSYDADYPTRRILNEIELIYACGREDNTLVYAYTWKGIHNCNERVYYQTPKNSQSIKEAVEDIREYL